MNPMLTLLLISTLLFSCADSPSSQSLVEKGEDVVAEPAKKTPALPTQFVDTTGKVYAWTKYYHQVHTIANRVDVPQGYSRTKVSEGSFGEWLRNLPTLPGKPDVELYNGQLKGNQSAHHLVLDIDVGNTDLQQCADAVMRLRSEYLWTSGDRNDISFNFTSGHACKWSDWEAGKRPVIKGNNVSFVQKASPSSSYKTFKSYLKMVFNYAGTASLAKEIPSRNLGEMEIGDVFIQGGFPGHAVIVVDMAEENGGSEKLFMLAQSYMPAQQIHVLRNPSNPDLSPWYKLSEARNLLTPEWDFSGADLRHF